MLKPDSASIFERYEYFVTDLLDQAAGKIVFNRVTGMKDSRGK